MEHLPALIQELNKCIEKDFDVTSGQLPVPTNQNEVKEKLTRIISYLLDKDFNRLLNIFYRIDLDEKKVAATLSLESPDKLPEKLAELVMERELKKAETRIRYRNNG